MFYGTYCSLNDLKRELITPNPTITTYDQALHQALMDASRRIDRHCRRVFYVSAPVARLFGEYSLALMNLRMETCGDFLTVTAVELDYEGDRAYSDILATTDYVLLPFAVDRPYPCRGIMLDYLRGDYSAWPVGPEVARVTAAWGFGDGFSTSPWSGAGITGTLSDTVTTSLVVSDPTKLSVGQTLLVGSEQLYVTAIPSATVSVVRAVNESAAATHANASISVATYPDEVRRACFIEAGRLWKRKDTVNAEKRGSSRFGSVQVTSGLDDDSVALLLPYVKRKLF